MTRIFRAVWIGFVTVGFALALAPTAPAQEGIKVIGDWTIVVRNEAGQEVQRTEFRNALREGGAPSLASLLGRGRAIGDWLILLANGSANLLGGVQPCGTAEDTQRGCGLIERPSSQIPFQGSTDYAVGLTVGQDPADPNKMTLRGSRRVTFDSYITTVSTMLAMCPPGPPSPTGCPTTQTFAYFSGTANFANPPRVAPGQTVDVSVTFSFQ
jgi:hypothetical protein